MAVAIGVWIAFAGALALLVGASARRRVRRLKRDGIKVWAESVHRPLPDGQQPYGRQSDNGQPVMLQYTLTDGRILERPARPRRASPLAPGQKVLVWYDPHDPAEVLVYGRDGRTSDLVFISIGLAFLLIGAVIAILAP
jgi:hypothetical protein